MGSKLKIAGGQDRPLTVVEAEKVAVDATFGGLGIDWSVVPEDLVGVGRTAWEHLAETFASDPARFREADRRALAAYCTAVEMEARAAEALRENGVLVEGRSREDRRPVRSPAWAMWRDAQTAVRQWGNELGLSPSSRSRLKLPEPGGSSEGNPFAPGS